jgi:hypothetical protein
MFHKYLGERSTQWSPLVVSEILFYFIIFPGTVILCGLWLLLGLLRGGLWLLLGRTEEGSKRLLLINVPVYLYHKSVEILRWFQRQIGHQRPIFF